MPAKSFYVVHSGNFEVVKRITTKVAKVSKKGNKIDTFIETFRNERKRVMSLENILTLKEGSVFGLYDSYGLNPDSLESKAYTYTVNCRSIEGSLIEFEVSKTQV